jgi:hypothetical protein
MWNASDMTAAQLSDEYTASQLEWWRCLLKVAPNLQLHLHSRGEAV